MNTENEGLFPHDERLEKLPIGEREKVLGEKLHTLVIHAYKNAPAVKERFNKAGIKPDNVHSIKDLEKLPVLRKDDLIQLQKDNPPLGGVSGSANGKTGENISIAGANLRSRQEK